MPRSAVLLGLWLSRRPPTERHPYGHGVESYFLDDDRHAPRLDAAASVAIGVLLVVIGIVLGRETRSLLLGESAATEVVASIRDVARAQPGVADARLPRTSTRRAVSRRRSAPDIHRYDACRCASPSGTMEAG